jgi:hypothetical protein
MMQTLLTRFAISVTRTVLLVPCLLICLACATPFPIDDLEKGMTTDAVRADFGEPEAIHGSAWHYTHEEQNWGMTAYCTLFAPFCALMSPISLLAEGKTIFQLAGVDEWPVVLQFEGEKLVRWEVLSDIRGSLDTGSDYSGYDSQQSLSDSMMQQQQQQKRLDTPGTTRRDTPGTTRRGREHPHGH